MCHLSRWVCKKKAAEFLSEYGVSFLVTFNAGR